MQLVDLAREKVNMKVADRATFGSLEDFITGPCKETVVELKVRVLVFHGECLVCELHRFADCALVVDVADCLNCARATFQGHGDMDGIGFS